MTVSALRTITIGARSSIYGVLPVQPALRWPVAEPDEMLDYALDITAPLADVDDTIEAAPSANRATVSPRRGATEQTARDRTPIGLLHICLRDTDSLLGGVVRKIDRG